MRRPAKREGGAVHRGKQERDQMDGTIVPQVPHNAVRLQLHTLPSNLANFMRTSAFFAIARDRLRRSDHRMKRKKQRAQENAPA